MTYRNKAATTGERSEYVQFRCRWCDRESSWDELSRNGARCGRCFDEYVNQGPRDHGALTVEDKKAIVRKMAGIGAANPRAWAHVLKAREEAGENLSQLQRKTWREALGVS